MSSNKTNKKVFFARAVDDEHIENMRSLGYYLPYTLSCSQKCLSNLLSVQWYCSGYYTPDYESGCPGSSPEWVPIRDLHGPGGPRAGPGLDIKSRSRAGPDV